MFSGVFLTERVDELREKGLGDTTIVDVKTHMEAFAGAFAKLQKATVSFVMTAHLFIHLHGTTLLPLNRFS